MPIGYSYSYRSTSIPREADRRSDDINTKYWPLASHLQHNPNKKDLFPVTKYINMAPALTTETPSNSSSAHALQNPIDPSFLDHLDKDFIEYYNIHLANKPATHSVSIADIRANPKKYASPWCRDFSNEPFVKDIKIKSDDGHEFTARCYHPDVSKSPFGQGPYPVHINFHGALHSRLGHVQD